MRKSIILAAVLCSSVAHAEKIKWAKMDFDVVACPTAKMAKKAYLLNSTAEEPPMKGCIIVKKDQPGALYKSEFYPVAGVRFNGKEWFVAVGYVPDGEWNRTGNWVSRARLSKPRHS